MQQRINYMVKLNKEKQGRIYAMFSNHIKFTNNMNYYIYGFMIRLLNYQVKHGSVYLLWKAEEWPKAGFSNVLFLDLGVVYRSIFFVIN